MQDLDEETKRLCGITAASFWKRHAALSDTYEDVLQDAYLAALRTLEKWTKERTPAELRAVELKRDMIDERRVRYKTRSIHKMKEKGTAPSFFSLERLQEKTRRDPAAPVVNSFRKIRREDGSIVYSTSDKTENALAEAFRNVSTKAREVARLYSTGLTQKEIGARLGFAESRACQHFKEFKLAFLRAYDSSARKNNSSNINIKRLQMSNNYPAKDNAQKKPKALGLCQAAQYLGISYERMRALVESGSIPNRKIGKRRIFFTDAIDEWMKGSDA